MYLILSLFHIHHLIFIGISICEIVISSDIVEVVHEYLLDVLLVEHSVDRMAAEYLQLDLAAQS
jgi:hypothetical protein